MPKALLWSLISGGLCLVLGILFALAWGQRRPAADQRLTFSPSPTPSPVVTDPTVPVAGRGGVVAGVPPQPPVQPPITRAGVALVFDPPSNVRAFPNGQIICAVREKMMINLYERQGLWYQTDVCGRMGWIHVSQLKF